MSFGSIYIAGALLVIFGIPMIIDSLKDKNESSKS